MTNHYETEIGLDIYSTIGIEKEAKLLIVKTLADIWPKRYEDLDIVDYINILSETWTKCYILSPNTKEAIEKIKGLNPPENLDIRLIFNLFDSGDNLIVNCSEVPPMPVFTIILPTQTQDTWDILVYNPEVKEFESIELIEPESIEEIRSSMSKEERINFDELILQTYEFHNRLLGQTTEYT